LKLPTTITPHDNSPQNQSPNNHGVGFKSGEGGSGELSLGEASLKERINSGLSNVPVPFESLVSLYNLPASTLLATLVEMEIEGSILNHNNGEFSKSM